MSASTLTGNSKARFFASSCCFDERDMRTLAHNAKAHGLHNLELGYSLTPESVGVDTLENLRGDGFQFLIHNYFPPPPEPFVANLASDDEGVAAATLDLCKKAILLCEQLCIPYYSVHSGFFCHATPKDLSRDLTELPRIDRRQGMDLLLKRLAFIANFAKERGISIAVENHVVAPFNLVDGENSLLPGATARELVEIIRSADTDNLFVLLDLGHLNVTASTLGFSMEDAVGDLAPHVLAVHVSANDGGSDQHLRLQTQDTAIMNAIDQLASYGPDYILETPCIGSSQVADQLRLIADIVENRE